MRRTSIINRRRTRTRKHFDLQLTSMMDMLVIILIFLLKSYTASSVAFSTSPNIKLPLSSTEDIPADAMNIVIEPNGIIFDGAKILDFKNPTGVEIKSENATYEIEERQLADSGRKILPLFDAMVKAKENAELLMSKARWVAPKNAPVTPNSASTDEKPKFQGALTIQADKAVKYDLIRKVMYTAGAAQYKSFKLITVKKDG